MGRHTNQQIQIYQQMQSQAAQQSALIESRAKVVPVTVSKPKKPPLSPQEAEILVRRQKVRASQPPECEIVRRADDLFERIEGAILKNANKVFIGESHVPLRPYPDCIIERVIKMFGDRGVPTVHAYCDEGLKKFDSLRFSINKIKMQLIPETK